MYARLSAAVKPDCRALAFPSRLFRPTRELAPSAAETGAFPGCWSHCHPIDCGEVEFLAGLMPTDCRGSSPSQTGALAGGDEFGRQEDVSMDRPHFAGLLHARRSLLGEISAATGLAAIPGVEAKKGKKKKKKPCPECLAGAVRLSNGTCAVQCQTVGEDFAGGCECSNVNFKGISLRVPHVEFCSQLARTCASTAECDRGQHCQPTGCPGENHNRCHSVCAPV